MHKKVCCMPTCTWSIELYRCPIYMYDHYVHIFLSRISVDCTFIFEIIAPIQIEIHGEYVYRSTHVDKYWYRSINIDMSICVYMWICPSPHHTHVAVKYLHIYLCAATCICTHSYWHIHIYTHIYIYMHTHWHILICRYRYRYVSRYQYV